MVMPGRWSCGERDHGQSGRTPPFVRGGRFLGGRGGGMSGRDGASGRGHFGGVGSGRFGGDVIPISGGRGRGGSFGGGRGGGRGMMFEDGPGRGRGSKPNSVPTGPPGRGRGRGGFFEGTGRGLEGVGRGVMYDSGILGRGTGIGRGFNDGSGRGGREFFGRGRGRSFNCPPSGPSGRGGPPQNNWHVHPERDRTCGPPQHFNSGPMNNHCGGGQLFDDPLNNRMRSRSPDSSASSSKVRNKPSSRFLEQSSCQSQISFDGSSRNDSDSHNFIKMKRGVPLTEEGSNDNMDSMTNKQESKRSRIDSNQTNRDIWGEDNHPHYHHTPSRSGGFNSGPIHRSGHAPQVSNRRNFGAHDGRNHWNSGNDGPSAESFQPSGGDIGQYDQFGRQIVNQSFSRGDRHHQDTFGGPGGPSFDRSRNYNRQIPSSDRYRDGPGRVNSASTLRDLHFDKSDIISSRGRGAGLELKDSNSCIKSRKNNELPKENERNLSNVSISKQCTVAKIQCDIRPQTPRSKEKVVNVVPLSPPAAPPSALALAMARLTDLAAQMEFQHAKYLQLSRDHESMKAKLSVLQDLPVGTDAFREDLERLIAEEKHEQAGKVEIDV